ncbi:hypothetical protein C8J30_101628 [Rhodobacter viridis]|uniref:Outer membrane protein with beta-barrel domain n=1 Tax=Rhodobacter viridis TaxID=1054202 RepID=A0A318U415_9RHOB|nr:hypothetical protein [Rhodobacter viridis]PYF13240.1 hypothetical protein C8J30_101628 [Rhodobacter viridis]
MVLSKAVFAVTVAALMLAAPARADPAVGLGVSIAFGGGQVQSGVGLRVFSDDEDDSVVATAGVDYLFQSKSWRGTFGGAYVNDDAYIGLDLGYGIGGGGFTYGPSGGFVNTSAPAVASTGGGGGGGGPEAQSPF